MLPTSGEIFYVDAVTNTYDVTTQGVSRMTTLQVSKGMYPNYIYGKEIGLKKFSYFDIIDFGEDFDIEKITLKNFNSFIGKWKVNVDNFGFFMSKQQLYWENINKYNVMATGNNSFELKEVVVTAKKK